MFKNIYKYLFILLISFSLPACSSTFKNLEIGLDNLKGTEQDNLFLALGYPDSKMELDDKTILYSWDISKSGSYTTPRTSTITQVVGDTVISRTVTNYSTQNYNSSCSIKYAVKDGLAYRFEVLGDSNACKIYADRLKKLEK